MVKGNKEPDPDFLNAGDEVLDGLELGSRFTRDLAHLDLLGRQPYNDKGPNTPMRVRVYRQYAVHGNFERRQ